MFSYLLETTCHKTRPMPELLDAALAVRPPLGAFRLQFPSNKNIAEFYGEDLNLQAAHYYLG